MDDKEVNMENQQLDNDKQQLGKDSQQLITENQQLDKENQQLDNDKQQLDKENQKFDNDKQQLIADNKKLNIVYEDNQILVVIKPQNVPSQPDSTNDEDMLTMVKNYVKEKYDKIGEAFVGLVHRLDRPTGGLMVFCRNSKSASRLSEQIKSQELTKEYLTVLVGKPKYDNDRLINYLKKDEIENVVRVVPMFETGAKRAELDYKILDHNDKLSLAKIKLFTGRSHQIRVQMATIGNPVFGDVKYHGDITKGYNLALWAYKLVFVHPTTKKIMNFISLPPEDEMPWKFFKFDKLLAL